MIAANITIPKGAICGTCNIIVSLAEPIEALARANIVLGGDTDGIDYTLSGSGAAWTLQFTFPADAMGQLTIGLTGEVVPTDSTDPVAIEQAETSFDYDTCHTLTAQWGAVVQGHHLITVPITFSCGIATLTKRHFRVYMGKQNVTYQVYGTEDNRIYSLQLRPPRGATGTLHVDLVKQVMKENGVALDVDTEPLLIQVT